MCRLHTEPNSMEHTVYLGLGTNLGNKPENIGRAIEHIEELVGNVTRRSALYDTAPWGFKSDNRFINAVVAVNTVLAPMQVLLKTQAIERMMGRTRKSRNMQYHDRIIDIDLLLYDNLHVSEPNLTIPHPLMSERDFVMQPLGEIADMAEVNRIIAAEG